MEEIIHDGRIEQEFSVCPKKRFEKPNDIYLETISISLESVHMILSSYFLIESVFMHNIGFHLHLLDSPFAY